LGQNSGNTNIKRNLDESHLPRTPAPPSSMLCFLRPTVW
jgi:hypothetical protein